MEDGDAAIIMVDLAHQVSIENAVSWYSKVSQLNSFYQSVVFSQLICEHIEEIMSSRQHSQHSDSVPVAIFSWKAYEKTDKRAINPTEISWSDDVDDIPFFYTTHLDLNEKANRIMADEIDRRPLGWILEQLTDEVNVVCFFFFTILVIPR